MSASYVRLYVHLVWTTKERRPALQGRRVRRLHGLLERLCNDRDCVAVAVGGVADHVHVLVGLHPDVAVSALVRDLKAASSMFVERTLSVDGFEWQRGYGAFSLRDVELETVRAYVRRQPEHHANGTVIEDWEHSGPPGTLALREGGDRI